MINTLAILGELEILEKLKKGKGKELRRRRSPQLSHPMTELRHHSRCRCKDALRGGEKGHPLSFVLHKIVQAKESAIKAVVVVVMSLFYVSDTLQTVVVSINCIMMHMQRRQHRHWQITSQQHKRCNISQQPVHLSGCKGTIFLEREE